MNHLLSVRLCGRSVCSFKGTWSRSYSCKVVWSGTLSIRQLREKRETRNNVYRDTDTDLTKPTWLLTLIDSLSKNDRHPSIPQEVLTWNLQLMKTVNQGIPDTWLGGVQESTELYKPMRGRVEGRGNRKEQKEAARKEYKRGWLHVKEASSVQLRQLFGSALCLITAVCPIFLYFLI